MRTSTFGTPSVCRVGVCTRCGRDIDWGQPYMSAIPFVGSWGGFWHQYCPPRLVVTTTVTSPGAQANQSDTERHTPPGGPDA